MKASQNDRVRLVQHTQIYRKKSFKNKKDTQKKEPQQPPPFSSLSPLAGLQLSSAFCLSETFPPCEKKQKKTKNTASGAISVFLSLAELLWVKLKFQQSYLEKHSAYYTAQFPILSQVHTQTQTLTHTQTHTHREYKMRPWHKTVSQTGSVIQKHIDKKGRLFWEVGGGIIVTIHMLLYKAETQHPSLHLKGLASCKKTTTTTAKKKKTEPGHLHHITPGWLNGVASRQRQAIGHYTNPQRGAIIAEGEYNQVLCLSLLQITTLPGAFHAHQAALPIQPFIRLLTSLSSSDVAEFKPEVTRLKPKHQLTSSSSTVLEQPFAPAAMSCPFPAAITTFTHKNKQEGKKSILSR